MNKILLFLCVLVFGTSQVGGQARPSATPTDALLVWARPTSDARASEVRAIGEAVEAAAELSGYSAWRLAALVKKESGARLDVVGKLGECGPAQVMGWYLRPVMRCAELQTADGGMLGAVRALQQWRRWADSRGLRPGAEWDCYAAGQHCKHYTRPGRATRRIYRGEATLRGIGAALDTTAGAEAIARAMRGPRS